MGGRKSAYVKTKKLDKKGEEILVAIQSNQKTDKEIANIFKVNLDVVKSIRKYHGQDIRTAIAASSTDTKPVETTDAPETTKTVVNRKQSHKLSDDDIMALLEDYTNGDNVKEIADKYNVTASYVYLLAKSYGAKETREKNIEDKKNKSNSSKEVTSVSNNTDNISNINSSTSSSNIGISKFVKCTKPSGVIDISVDDMITIESNNFDDMYSEGKGYILSTIEFSQNVARKKVLLSLSKSQIKNLIAIKVLESLSVNTSVVINNNSNYGNNRTLTLFNSFPIDGTIEPSHIEKEIRMYDSVYLYEMKKSIEVPSHFYKITKIIKKGIKDIKTGFIFANASDAWNYYSSLVEEILNNHGEKVKLKIEECINDEKDYSIMQVKTLAVSNNMNNL